MLFIYMWVDGAGAETQVSPQLPSGGVSSIVNQSSSYDDQQERNRDKPPIWGRMIGILVTALLGALSAFFGWAYFDRGRAWLGIFLWLLGGFIGTSTGWLW